MAMEINGVAHIVLTVSNFEVCAPFYERLLEFLGLKQVFKLENYLYYVGGRTAVGISAADEEYQRERFVHCNRIIAKDLLLHPKLPKVLNQIVGEGVVVIDYE